MKRKISDLQNKIKPILHTTSASIDLGKGSFVDFTRSVLTTKQSTTIFEALKQQLFWQHRQVRVFNKNVFQPRLIAYQGDLQYTYSGQTLEPSPWDPTVLQLKQTVESLTGTKYNSCLLNRYRSGSDSISWHSDNEPLYGATPTIAMLSFGATRDFVLRCNEDRTLKHIFPIEAGDLLVMRGTTQQYWMHSLPKRMKVDGERISLTFRRILQPEEAS